MCPELDKAIRDRMLALYNYIISVPKVSTWSKFMRSR